MGGDNNGKRQSASSTAPPGEGGRRSSSKNSGQPAQDQAKQLPQLPPPPLPGMEPKARPAPELPRADAPFSCLNSLNYLSTNPDAMRPNTVPCCCGRPIKTDGEDWYTEIYDGTVRCLECSFCARCGTDGLLHCRRNVSIGGHVLCYGCLIHYGSHRKGDGGQLVAPRIVFNEKNKTNRQSADQKETQLNEQSPEKSGGNNSFLCESNASNWWQSNRSPECRRILRYRSYPRPVKYVPERDPKIKFINYYSASRPEFERMVCPTCKVAAKGKKAYVVPGISLVYHRKCFFCLACQSPLSTGVKRAGVHFVFCTCTTPLQWCTKSACTRHRMEHHALYKCCLEPIHPGGRQQNDTRILSSQNLKDREDKKRKKSAGTAAAESPDGAVANVNETILKSASNALIGLKAHQQYIKLSKPTRPPVKDGRLVHQSPSIATPAPSVSSAGSPEFSTAVAAAPPNLFRAGRSTSRRKVQTA